MTTRPASTASSAPQPLRPKGGPYANDSMAALALHVSRETMHHGGEIGVLRDLYLRMG